MEERGSFHSVLLWGENLLPTKLDYDLRGTRDHERWEPQQPVKQAVCMQLSRTVGRHFVYNVPQQLVANEPPERAVHVGSRVKPLKDSDCYCRLKKGTMRTGQQLQLVSRTQR